MDINTKKSALSFPVIFQKIEDINENDARFTRVKIWLMHLGENFNGSCFDKDAVVDAIPTLQYIPIVGFIEDNSIDEKDFSVHKYTVIRKENGLERKYIGVAYGVITSTEDNNAHFEERLCDDGVTREFLVVEGLLWNMFEDSIDIMNRDIIKNNSMELWDNELGDYEGYADENGIFHFTKFSFRAACILGKDYEPGMINSTIEVQFTLSDFVKNLQSELNDKLTTFARLTNKKQGGIDTMAKTNYSQTVLEQFEDISAIVSKQETMVDRWGDAVSRYYLRDIQDNEVIVVDRKDSYHYYGFPFVVEGDKPVIDFSQGKRKKLRFEDYEDGSDIEGTFDFGKHIAEIEDAAFSKIESLQGELETANTNASNAQTDYNKIKEEFDEIKPKYDEYVLAEEKSKAEAVEAHKDTLFTSFDAHLSDMDEYKTIKDNRDNLSVEEIENQCSVLYTKKSLNNGTNFNKNANSNVVIAGVPDVGMENNENYVSTKYGNIPIN